MKFEVVVSCAVTLEIEADAPEEVVEMVDKQDPVLVKLAREKMADAPIQMEDIEQAHPTFFEEDEM